MASTPGYEESTDHTACKRDNAALETKLRDGQVTIAEKDRVIKDQDAKIKSLEAKIESLEKGNGTGRETSWIGVLIDRGGAFLTMLDKKKYGPLVEHGVSIIAGSLVGYSMK